MPAVPNVPSVPRRQVAHILSKLHAESGLYIKDIAERIDLHHTTVSRMLKGEPCKLKAIYLDKLCDIYGAEDAVRRELKVLAVEAESAHGWWHTLTDTESANQLGTYITLETTAATITTYQNTRLPGLIQTPEYARALLRTSPYLGSEEVEHNIEIRMGRRIALTKPEARLDIILDENVIRRFLAEPDVAEGQLRHIIGTSRMPSVRIRLVPFEVGIYRGTETGPFSILEFAAIGNLNPDPPVVYVESGVGSALYFDTSEQVARYRKSWSEIERVVLNAPRTRARLTEIMQEVSR
ncbi:Scr1 family TA system antitoxin-like transcriptional regulator [Nocardia macrotermitis]|uniref:Uncharacterized protein n=1 Tax=Nocardia macrotermitis TaxID=2585198 RepID=A0A7K0D1C1_9NOCA|nr:Scr1 family TA system antitoxin-like transcriptional regulator [Nocardia macrotermitis]MQY19488.1 hypothetical protein [Nocardia macrotermitis]